MQAGIYSLPFRRDLYPYEFCTFYWVLGANYCRGHDLKGELHGHGYVPNIGFRAANENAVTVGLKTTTWIFTNFII